MKNIERDFIRHTLATVAYRGGKTLRDAPRRFADFKAGDSTKSPLEILSHIGDLYDWALSQAKGNEVWTNSKTLEWDDEVARFFESLDKFDEYIRSGSEIHVPFEQLFQGPIADSLTHIGQLAMLRRLADSPIKGENYARAKIEKGLLGIDQKAPKFEFD
ncbi:MAG: hypothetical protein R2681_06980 [Pyrinomonadaceae bacterium]